MDLKKRFTEAQIIGFLREASAGLLWCASHAPQFKLPAYRVFARDSDNATLKQSLEGLRELARAEQERGE